MSVSDCCGVLIFRGICTRCKEHAEERVSIQLTVGSLYEIWTYSGAELFGYTVYEKECDAYIVGYDGVDGGLDVRMRLYADDIRSADLVD